ncbi:MAG TPA: hypothetical protein VI653_10010 [Steroidobacteraceae bacterium]
MKRSIGIVLALLFLNFALTFENVWPTPAVRWAGEVSVELAVLTLLLALSHVWRDNTSPRVLNACAVAIVVLTLGRYGDVTAPALYGRPINLYWDLPNMGSVVAMVARAAPLWAITAAALGIVAVLALMYAGARWAIGRVDEALRMLVTRRVLGFLAAGSIIIFAAQAIFEQLPEIPSFATPVSQTYAQQIARVYDTLSERSSTGRLPPSPRFHSDLQALGNRDVLVIFLESYGRVTYEHADIAREVTPARERLAATVNRTGRSMVSAFVTSPTFGGGSWLAHSSLMSGIDVNDPDRYGLLLTQERPTLASFFAQNGYRVVADMPGIRQRWPEGSFYRFDALYNAPTLNYQGPEFGWWRIPDQFSLAVLDAREIQPQPRKPLFVLFPTINTHMPWRPIPPLQSDWHRVLTRKPFDAPEVEHSLKETPAWTNLGASYAASFVYSFQLLTSYLVARADHDFVLILIGDHQPAATVSGENAPWDVPVHVITRSPEIVASLKRSGFVDGATPAPRPISRMNALSQTLLDAFSGPGSPPAGLSRPRFEGAP